MPPPRKIDLLPDAQRTWLQERLKDEGFANYVQITEELNERLAQDGVELRLGKSAVHAYGKDFRQFAELQRQSQDEISAFFKEMDLGAEKHVTDALFQQLTTLQWRLQIQLASPDSLPDPRGLKDLTTALNNLIRSAELRDKIARDVKKEVAQSLDQKTRQLGLTKDTVEGIKAQILGVG
ncbi:MAG: phage protein Gp27 family protein [Planktomarina sp.]